MKIQNYEPWLDIEERGEVLDCLNSGWVTGGPKVKKFEEEIAKLHKVKHTVAVMNGTMALYMAIESLSLTKPFEVIVPDFTFIASANAVVLAGGVPVFCDVDKDTFNIDCVSAERCITPYTKAIMPVHIFGQAANMDDVKALADKYNLSIVEDAAQGIGVSFRGVPVGGIGDVGILSFYSDKTITTGCGGMVLTNDDKIAEKCLRLKHQGRTGRGWYIHDEIGYNFRMPDIAAAIGLAQLRKLPEIISRKRYHEMLYHSLLCDLPYLSLPFVDKRSSSVPFRHNVLVNEPVKLQKYLDEQGIGTRTFFYPLHKQPCYKSKSHVIGDNRFPNSVWANEHGLSLPSSATLTAEQIEYVCNAIKEFYK